MVKQGAHKEWKAVDDLLQCSPALYIVSDPAVQDYAQSGPGSGGRLIQPARSRNTAAGLARPSGSMSVLSHDIT